MPGPKQHDVARYLADNSMPEPNSGCLLWVGSFTNVGGQLRGYMRNNGKRDYAYRYAWQDANGPIPPGAHVLHRCDVSLCVNPAHLFLGDQIANMLDKLHKGRTGNKFQASKTHCANGHPFSPENTRIISRGGYQYRRCRICARDVVKRQRAKGKLP